MSYDQWIEITIDGPVGKELHVRNARLKWGKFHQPSNKDVELKPEAINELALGHRHRVGDAHRVVIAACGRQGAASGTQGEFELYDFAGKLSARCEWDCPWGTAPNSFIWHPANGWSADIHGDRLAEQGAEHFTTVKDPLRLRDQVEQKIINNGKIPEAIKFPFRIIVHWFTSPTPGPLGAIHVSLKREKPEQVTMV